MNAALTPLRRDEMIEALAAHVRALGLRVPAMLLLEIHAPFSFLVSQFFLALQPFVGFFAGDRAACELAVLLEDSANVGRLLSILEEERLVSVSAASSRSER